MDGLPLDLVDAKNRISLRHLDQLSRLSLADGPPDHTPAFDFRPGLKILEKWSSDQKSHIDKALKDRQLWPLARLKRKYNANSNFRCLWWSIQVVEESTNGKAALTLDDTAPRSTGTMHSLRSWRVAAHILGIAF